MGTVSNVLNRPEVVRHETRVRVQARDGSPGLRAQRVGAAAAAGRSRTLAYVMLDATNPFFTDVARGAEDGGASRRGLAALHLQQQRATRPARTDYLDLLQQQRVQGILITPLDRANPRLRTLPDQGTPVVLVDRPAGVATPAAASPWTTCWAASSPSPT